MKLKNNAKLPFICKLICQFCCPALMVATCQASNFDTIGVTLLRAVSTNLNGSGIRVAQVEAPTASSTPPPFEVNPAAVQLPNTNFNYFIGPPTTTSSYSANGYPNSFGTESPHADSVGNLFYGIPNGVSTNVLSVDNYEASYFFFTVVPGQLSIKDSIVNQSFAANVSANVQQSTYDLNYDNYAAQYGTLFVSAVGNSGSVSPPATCYNGIGVGAYQGGSSVGPTPDNGRAKPDLVAPASETSYSTPLVSGAAAILLQAARRWDSGASSNTAGDLRTIKALLLNGALKPQDWANPAPSPLDPRYGAGVLNVFNSHKQLMGGRHGFIESGSVTTGNAHPSGSANGNLTNLTGWDFNTISNTSVSDTINHYYFNLQTNPANATFTGTMTLVWNRQAHQNVINNLDLFLYNTVTGTLIGSSTSIVDNVEHIYLRQIPQGRYDLQVLKHGGTNSILIETYSLAYDFFTLPLNICSSTNGVVVTWPIYPTGFTLQSCSNYGPSAVWNNVNSTPIITNRQNQVTLSSSSASQTFRLYRP